MRLTKREMRGSWDLDRRRLRRRYAAAAAVAAAGFLLCLCFRYNAYYYEQKLTLAENLRAYALALRLLAARITDSELFRRRDALIDAFGSVAYYGALARLRITLSAFVSGAALAVSGAVFQTAYRNPMASPSIIGAAVGVDLGNVLVVALYSAAAYENILLRYRFCYGFTALCVGLVFLLGRLGGAQRRKNYGTMEMILAGSVVSQVVRVFSMYLMYELPEEDLLLYEEISLGTYPDWSARSTAVFFGVMALSLLPVLAMRWRLNVLALDRAESRSLGAPAGALRVIAQLCGVLMVTCAMIHRGEVGMLSLVIPCAVRRFIDADFRHLCCFSALAGGTLLMLCDLAASFVYIADAPLPVTFVIELVLVPVFLVILAKSGRRNHAV